MTYIVIRSKDFKKEFSKLSQDEQREINNFEVQLSENPYVGKPLSFSFIREKKFGNKRAYYIIYDELILVFMVDISDKKSQQKRISGIKRKLKDYYEIAKKYQITLVNPPFFMLSKAFINFAFSNSDIPVYFLRPSLAFLTVSVSSLIF